MPRRSLGKATEKMKEAKTGPFEEILPLINQGKVIPIISNSFCIEPIFADEEEITDEMDEKPDFDDEDLTIDEQLTKEWAKFIEYPMPDSHNLARVAQYHLVEEKDNPYLARKKYVDFIKGLLLNYLGDNEEYKDRISQLKLEAKVRNFSDIVNDLDLPKFPEKVENPLRLLARLKLPIYVTTSYYDFLERAIEAEGMIPRTQICFWSEEITDARPEHHLDNEFVPSPGTPMVYHLYGLEDYPKTLVLSEDDYIRFLISVLSHTDKLNPLVPSSLVQKLVESKLLLLGYQLKDWDFRALFRFLSEVRKGVNKGLERGMVIQFNQSRKAELGDESKTIEYLRAYFNQENFEVQWRNVDTFVRELWNEWNRDREGE